MRASWTRRRLQTPRPRVAEQRLILDSAEAVELAAKLCGALKPVYANGTLPEGLAGSDHVIIFGRAQEWVDRIDALQRASGSPIVRPGVGDFLEIDQKQPFGWLRDRVAKIPSSAPQPAAPSVAPPVPESGKAAAAEPTGSLDEPLTEPARTAQDDAILDFHAQIPPEGAESSVQPLRKRTRPKLAIDNGNLARAPDPDDEPLPASLSEDALAEHFVETRGERWRYVPEWGIWLEWRGDGWHRDELFKVAHECKEITRECLQWPEARTLTPDGKRKISSKRMAWNVRDMAEVHPKISIHAAELDADPWMLGVPGGVVDLKTGKLLEADPEQYITRRTIVAPEEGQHPLFDRVLARAESGHDGMRAYLLRALGYCLTGQTNEEVFFHLTGAGGSGKGTLTRALQAIWGDYSDTIAMDALIETKQARHTQEIAKLEGMRLVFANESEEGRRFNESLIKWLTGGDRVTAHRMRMDDHTFTPTFKLLLSANSTPHLKSVSDGAMKRRIHLIEYAAPIAEEDKDATLKARMVSEYPAILHTLIQGCVDWQDCHGLGKPESVIASVDSYLEEEDSFAEFLAECIQPERGAKTRSGAVYKAYLDWCHRNGEKYPLAMKRFVQTMRGRGYESTRSAAGKLMAGLKLLVAPGPEYPPPFQDRD